MCSTHYQEVGDHNRDLLNKKTIPIKITKNTEYIKESDCPYAKPIDVVGK